MIVSGSKVNLQYFLEQLLLNHASYHDSAEKFYHGVMFTLCCEVRGYYDIKS